MGIREAEDLPVVLEFARFAEGKGTLAKLEDYLRDRVKQFLESKEAVLLRSSI